MARKGLRLSAILLFVSILSWILQSSTTDGTNFMKTIVDGMENEYEDFRFESIETTGEEKDEYYVSSRSDEEDPEPSPWGS